MYMDEYNIKSREYTCRCILGCKVSVMIGLYNAILNTIILKKSAM